MRLKKQTKKSKRQSKKQSKKNMKNKKMWGGMFGWPWQTSPSVASSEVSEDDKIILKEIEVGIAMAMGMTSAAMSTAGAISAFQTHCPKLYAVLKDFLYLFLKMVHTCTIGGPVALASDMYGNISEALNFLGSSYYYISSTYPILTAGAAGAGIGAAAVYSYPVLSSLLESVTAKNPVNIQIIEKKPMAAILAEFLFKIYKNRISTDTTAAGAAAGAAAAGAAGAAADEVADEVARLNAGAGAGAAAAAAAAGGGETDLGLKAAIEIVTSASISASRSASEASRSASRSASEASRSASRSASEASRSADKVRDRYVDPIKEIEKVQINLGEIYTRSESLAAGGGTTDTEEFSKKLRSESPVLDASLFSKNPYTQEESSRRSPSGSLSGSPPASQPGSQSPPASQPGSQSPPARQPGSQSPPASQPGGGKRTSKKHNKTHKK